MAKPIYPDETAVDRLGKLLPAEVTGLYVSLRAFFDDSKIPGSGYYIVGVALVSTIMALFYIIYVRKVKNSIHIALYTITFAAWALSLDAETIRQTFFDKDTPLPQIAGSISILLSFVFPLLVPSSTVATTEPVPPPQPPQV